MNIKKKPRNLNSYITVQQITVKSKNTIGFMALDIL